LGSPPPLLLVPRLSCKRVPLALLDNGGAVVDTITI
jgi:hypothetical protein